MGEAMRLWDHDHPYYCADGCYWGGSGETYQKWDSWAAFERAFTDMDVDLNIVWRWDWKGRRADPEWDSADCLSLFMMLQRKAAPVSHDIAIRDEDEPRVRLFLQKHWARLQEMWAPFHAGSGEDQARIAEEIRKQRIATLRAELANLESEEQGEEG